MSSTDQNIKEFDCVICADCCPESEGNRLCDDHFCCNPCTLDMLQRSLRYLDEFPASCCSSRTSIGMPPAHLKTLLGEVFMEKYRLRLLEHETPILCACTVPIRNAPRSSTMTPPTSTPKRPSDLFPAAGAARRHVLGARLRGSLNISAQPRPRQRGNQSTAHPNERSNARSARTGSS
jgi:hypothetical protein